MIHWTTFQVSKLESDKACLMDRVEELTGTPLGDVSAPVDVLSTCKAHARKSAPSTSEALKALASIVRMVGNAEARSPVGFLELA